MSVIQEREESLPIFLNMGNFLILVEYTGIQLKHAHRYFLNYTSIQLKHISCTLVHQ